MEWISWFCLIILIYYSSYLIVELVGKKCKITNENGSQNSFIYTILDADDEWVKVSYTDKKDVVETEIIRIDSIKKVDLIAKLNK